MGSKENSVPHFDTEEQEADYWDTHSPLDVATEPEVQEVRVRGAKDRPITIRLDTATRQRLNKLAEERGLGPSTLARSILVSAVDSQEYLPKGIDLRELKETMRQMIPESLASQVDSLMQAAALGDRENPSALVFDGSQIKELEEIGLYAVKAILAILDCWGTEFVVTDSTVFSEVRDRVHAEAERGRGQ